MRKALRLAEIDIFFMDETPMLARYGFECTDRELRELRKNSTVPFGGAIMVFGGGFLYSHTPIKVNISIGSSALWKQSRKMKLCTNMRVTDANFVEWRLEMDSVDVIGR